MLAVPEVPCQIAFAPTIWFTVALFRPLPPLCVSCRSRKALPAPISMKSTSPLAGQPMFAVPSIQNAGQPPLFRLGTSTRVSIMPYFTVTKDFVTTLPEV
ncbi:MAG: hypothetical protein IPJ04_09960 [Candidatus Eisenbacteria bacterium]|nr:hypothetical protein [Candidatus Eisenbacteria bacterium]